MTCSYADEFHFLFAFSHGRNVLQTKEQIHTYPRQTYSPLCRVWKPKRMKRLFACRLLLIFLPKNVVNNYNMSIYSFKLSCANIHVWNWRTISRSIWHKRSFTQRLFAHRERGASCSDFVAECIMKQICIRFAGLSVRNFYVICYKISHRVCAIWCNDRVSAIDNMYFIRMFIYIMKR